MVRMIPRAPVPAEWSLVPADLPPSLRCPSNLSPLFFQSEKDEDVVGAVGACSTLFCSLLQRREMFRGKLPGEEEAMCGACS